MTGILTAGLTAVGLRPLPPTPPATTPRYHGPPPLTWRGRCPCGPHDATWAQHPYGTAWSTCEEAP